MPYGHIISRFIEYKLRIEFVDSIVCEVDIVLLQVGRVRLHIRLSCKPG